MTGISLRTTHRHCHRDSEDSVAKQPGSRSEPTDGAERRSAPRGPAYTVVIHLTEKGLHVLKLGESAPIKLSTDEIAEVVRSGARVLVARDIHGDGPCAAIPLGQRGSVPPEERHARVTPEDHCAVFARDDSGPWSLRDTFLAAAQAKHRLCSPSENYDRGPAVK